jgi:hypothetical protein
VTTLTSGSGADGTAAVATVGSSHPANSGATARSINAMHAERARIPDIENIAPLVELNRKHSFARDVAMTPRCC